MATKSTKKNLTPKAKASISRTTKTVVRTLEPASPIVTPKSSSATAKSSPRQTSTVPALLGLIAVLVIASAAVVYVLNKGTEDNTNIVETTLRIQKKKNVSDTVSTTSSFSSLTKALKAADLYETLKTTGPFTIFAPNDTAFGKLAAGKVDELFMPVNKPSLANILKYHVVIGTVIAKDMTDGKELTTLQGEIIKISLRDGSIMLTDAKGGVSKILKADIDATNGVIHRIDTVLMPAN